MQYSKYTPVLIALVFLPVFAAYTPNKNDLFFINKDKNPAWLESVYAKYTPEQKELIIYLLKASEAPKVTLHKDFKGHGRVECDTYNLKKPGDHYMTHYDEEQICKAIADEDWRLDSWLSCPDKVVNNQCLFTPTFADGRDYSLNPLIVPKLQALPGSSHVQLEWGYFPTETITVYWREGNTPISNKDDLTLLKHDNSASCSSWSGCEILIQGLRADQDYQFAVLHKDPDFSVLLNASVHTYPAVQSPSAPKINDTGMVSCSDGLRNDLICESGGEQDGNYAVDGHFSPQFTRVGQGTDQCVKDHYTGLMWEVKQPFGETDLLRSADHAYRWYDPNQSTNGGYPGEEGDASLCHNTLDHCNTLSFVQAVNEQGLCGYHDWRLPTVDELRSIVDYSRVNPSIDKAFFPYTKDVGFFSSQSNAAMPSMALHIQFHFGVLNSYPKFSKYGGRIRLVRDDH